MRLPFSLACRSAISIAMAFLPCPRRRQPSPHQTPVPMPMRAATYAQSASQSLWRIRRSMPLRQFCRCRRYLRERRRLFRRLSAFLNRDARTPNPAHHLPPDLLPHRSHRASKPMRSKQFVSPRESHRISAMTAGQDHVGFDLSTHTDARKLRAGAALRNRRRCLCARQQCASSQHSVCRCTGSIRCAGCASARWNCVA